MTHKLVAGQISLPIYIFGSSVGMAITFASGCAQATIKTTTWVVSGVAAVGDVKEFGFRELPHTGARDAGAAATPGERQPQAELPALQPVPLAADGEADPRLALTICVSGAPFYVQMNAWWAGGAVLFGRLSGRKLMQVGVGKEKQMTIAAAGAVGC